MLLLLLSLTAHAVDLADAVASGDCATVLATVDAEDPGDARLARGWCALKSGDPKEAVAVLSVPMDGVLGEYGRLVRARAHLALGEADAAAKALAGLELPGEAGRELRLTRARLAVQRKDRVAFEAEARGLKEPEIGFLRGELAWALGEREVAWAAWTELHTAARVGGWDARAEARLAETGGPAPEGDVWARTLELKKRGRIDEAAELAAGVEARDATQRVALARVFMAARRYPEALSQWNAALGPPRSASGSASPLFDYALSHARTGDYDTAAVIYRRVIAQHPGHERAVEASYKLGYMAYDAGDCARSIPLFEEHLAAFADSRYLDEALWFSARCRWKSGDVDGAVRDWERLVAKRPGSSLVSGAAYWTARARGRQGDAEGERAGLERVLRSWPESGYAWFAAERLGKRFEAHDASSRPPWPSDLARDPAVRRAETLLSQGFRDWARAELATVAGRANGREASLAASWALLEAGDYKGARKLASGFCVAPWKGGDPQAQQVCTPRPEAGIVSAVAARFDLDPLLPYGIMTAESALDPAVTSPAGARGLMQLMPKEGPRIHAALYEGRPYDADDLYSAPYNASMGTAELGLKRQSLGDVLDGSDLPAVIASYNGGEEAVRRWLEAYPSAPEADEFAEDISFTETRRYVKRVLGFLMAYRYVYGDGVAE